MSAPRTQSAFARVCSKATHDQTVLGSSVALVDSSSAASAPVKSCIKIKRLALSVEHPVSSGLSFLAQLGLDGAQEELLQLSRMTNGACVAGADVAQSHDDLTTLNSIDSTQSPLDNDDVIKLASAATQLLREECARQHSHHGHWADASTMLIMPSASLCDPDDHAPTNAGCCLACSAFAEWTADELAFLYAALKSAGHSTGSVSDEDAPAPRSIDYARLHAVAIGIGAINPGRCVADVRSAADHLLKSMMSLEALLPSAVQPPTPKRGREVQGVGTKGMRGGSADGLSHSCVPGCPLPGDEAGSVTDPAHWGSQKRPRARPAHSQLHSVA